MTSPVTANVGRFSATAIAVTLAVAVVLIVLFTPEPAGESRGGVSTFSTAPGGAGIVFELAQRLGWRTERRLTTLDSVRPRADNQPTVQVVLAPQEDLGAHEIHNLLENVRRGGGLIVSLDGDDDLRDSLGLGYSNRTTYLSFEIDPTCSRGFDSESIVALPPTAEVITWHKAPAHVDTLVRGMSTAVATVAGVGFPVGTGHVAVVGGSDVFTNQALRSCRWAADVAAMKLVEYTRPAGDSTPLLVFDEFHHGFGVHGGTMTAAANYLVRTGSGRMLAQLVAAGLLLLFAAAPRPLVPRDDTHVARRSPLEHAEALGRAYEDVRATRTATATLVGGLRRRTRGIVAIPASAGDDEFLAAVTRRIPSLAAQVAVVDRARRDQTTPRDFTAVGKALDTIEQRLMSTPSTGP